MPRGIQCQRRSYLSLTWVCPPRAHLDAGGSPWTACHSVFICKPSSLRRVRPGPSRVCCLRSRPRPCVPVLTGPKSLQEAGSRVPLLSRWAPAPPAALSLGEGWCGLGSAPVAHQVGAGHSCGPWVGPRADPRPAACGALSYQGIWRQRGDLDPATGRLRSAQGLRGRGPETPELKSSFFPGFSQSVLLGSSLGKSYPLGGPDDLVPGFLPQPCGVSSLLRL